MSYELDVRVRMFIDDRNRLFDALKEMAMAKYPPGKTAYLHPFKQQEGESTSAMVERYCARLAEWWLWSSPQPAGRIRYGARTACKRLRAERDKWHRLFMREREVLVHAGKKYYALRDERNALQAELIALQTRVDQALNTAGSRWSEWGDRAEQVCALLEGREG